MSSDESPGRIQRLAHELRDFANSGIGRVYLSVTVLSIAAISLAVGSLGAGIALGGWVGMFAAILVNEVTPGYTMEDSVLAGGRSG